MSLKRGELVLHSALTLLAELAQGRPSCQHPSRAPSFRHLRFEPELPTAAVRVRSAMTPDDVAFLCTLCSRSLYSGHISNVLPLSLQNHCLFGTALAVLTALTLLGESAAVVQALVAAAGSSAIRWNLAERFGTDNDTDHPLIMPLLLAMEGGSASLLAYYVETGRLKGAVDDATLQLHSSIHSSSAQIKAQTLIFLSCLSAKEGAIMDVLVRKGNFVAAVTLQHLSTFSGGSRMWPSLVAHQYPGAMADSFRALDTANLVILLAKTMVAGGQAPGRLERKIGRSGGVSVPYHSPHNVFLLEFCLAGNGIQVAADMFVYASCGLAELARGAAASAAAGDGGDASEECRQEGRREGRSQWEAFVAASCKQSLRDVVLFALEFLCDVTQRRPEVQTHLSEACRDVFTWLPSHLRPPPPRPPPPPPRSEAEGCDDGDTNAAQAGFGFHVGIAECVARFIAVACWRHDACQTLTLTSGCIEGLMAALETCATLPPQHPSHSATDHPRNPPMSPVYTPAADRDTLSGSIVQAIELLVVRNDSAWRYVQNCSGITGLLQLSMLGGTKIKNLSCSTLMDASTDCARPSYADDVTFQGGIRALAPLLGDREDETTIICALRLLNTLCIYGPAFRRHAFSPQGRVLFDCLLHLLCCNRRTEIRSLVCEILTTFGADKPALLRHVLQDDTGGAMDVLLEMSSGSSAADSPDLIKSAVTSLACMTISDDSEYPTGAPYLRSVLHSAGYLPSLK